MHKLVKRHILTLKVLLECDDETMDSTSEYLAEEVREVLLQTASNYGWADCQIKSATPEEAEALITA